MAYGMLPWIAIICLSWADFPERRYGRCLRVAALTIVVALGSITPGGGALCLFLIAVCTFFLRIRPLPWAWLVIGSVVQLPWILSGLVSTGHAGSPDPALSVGAFSLRSETGWGSVVDALGLGGM
jgi:hypothetical protein